MVHTEIFEQPLFEDYELLDSGNARKLERFGKRILDRPDPQALWEPLDPEAWARADLRFERESDRGGRWEGRLRSRREEHQWPLAFGEARFLIRPTPFKHVGLFPEQASNWVWTAERLRALAAGEVRRGGARPRLLNLFGYTGAGSVLAAKAGAEVTHVDASRTTLAWMRENLEQSGLAGDAVRIVLEDALRFVRREVRRGSRYAGVLLDPPHYGRGPKGETWRFEEDIAALLRETSRLLAEESFLVLSTYSIGLSPLSLHGLLSELEGGEVRAGELALPHAASSTEGAPRLLPCGCCARWWR